MFDTFDCRRRSVPGAETPQGGRHWAFYAARFGERGKLDETELSLSGRCKLDEAEPFLKRALGPFFVGKRGTLDEAELLLTKRGRLDEAEPLQRRTLAIN